MKNRVKKYTTTASLLCVMSTSLFMHGTTVVWPPVTSVTDASILITAFVTLPTGITSITSLTETVSITPQDHCRTIASSDSSSSTQFNFSDKSGLGIEVQLLNHGLNFSQQGPGSFKIITELGATNGTVTYNISNGNTLRFIPNC